MAGISMYSQYLFKSDYCRVGIGARYMFNGVQSFIDVLNGELYNTEKSSWDAWYYMYSDENDKVYQSKQSLRIYR